MTILQIAFLVFGVGVVSFQVFRLIKPTKQLSTLKRRQEMVFVLWYSLLIVMICLPSKFDGWKLLADLAMLSTLIYWFVVRKRLAEGGR